MNRMGEEAWDVENSLTELSVDLTKTKITEAGLEKLQRQMPMLKIERREDTP